MPLPVRKFSRARSRTWKRSCAKEVNRPLIEGGYLDADEFGRILDSRPRYIVKRPGETTYLDEVRRAALNNLLSEHYELWKSARDIEVYRLR
jgi:hypothetical protein